MRATFVSLALAAVALAAGCSSPARSSAPPKAFCDAATRYENELQAEATSGRLDTAKQISIVEQMASTAPTSVRADAQTFLDALRQVQHDPRLRDKPSIKTAVDNVNRYASNKCGLFNQQPGLM